MTVLVGGYWQDRFRLPQGCHGIFSAVPSRVPTNFSWHQFPSSSIISDEFKEVLTGKFLQAFNQNQKGTPMQKVHLFGKGEVVLYSPPGLCTLKGETF